MKKFELTEENIIRSGTNLFRIRSLISFGNVKKGDLGGFIEKESNLDHSGDAWVYGDAEVYSDARICGNAWVYGYARVGGSAYVCDDSEIYENACVDGNSYVGGDAKVGGNAYLCEDALVYCDDDYVCIRGVGSKNRTTTFFRTRDGIGVKCGCFSGSLQKFRERVYETHGGSKYMQEYLMAADLIELHFQL